ncbi:hypothetical protein QCA50_007154 [Cerrena zonata]|uniref:MARVEL domain-containing protein n=1 Tax=Cerrena zonata TaxID=2478898 RepID=A0AAW0G6T3_9APHY
MSLPTPNTKHHDWLPTYRVSALSAVSGFSVIVLAVSAHYIAQTLTGTLFIDGIQVLPADSPDSFSVFNLVVALFTFITVPAMLTIDRLRKGAVTSLIMVELIWFGVLSVLWVAAAGLTADTIGPIVDLCKVNPRVKILQRMCKDGQVAAAFGFLAFIALLSYVVILLAQSIISSQHGSPVWKTSVSRANFKGSIAPVLNVVHQGANALLSDTPMKENVEAAYPPSQHQGQHGATQQQQAGYFNGAATGNTTTYTPSPVTQQTQLPQGYQAPDVSYGYDQQQTPQPQQPVQGGYTQGPPPGVAQV